MGSRSRFRKVGTAEGGFAKRLGWFATLYVGSLCVFAALVYGLRAIVPH